MRRIVLDIAARVDTVAIVNTSFLNFGLQASIRYSQLISQAYLDLADAPQRPEPGRSRAESISTICGTREREGSRLIASRAHGI